jgi:hypothetical protein
LESRQPSAVDRHNAREYRLQAISNIGSISQTIHPTVDELTNRAPIMGTVANTTVIQTEVAGLNGGVMGPGSGGGVNGEAVTLGTLGLRSFSATVKTIATDEGDLYELETTEE